MLRTLGRQIELSENKIIVQVKNKNRTGARAEASQDISEKPSQK